MLIFLNLAIKKESEKNPTIRKYIPKKRRRLTLTSGRIFSSTLQLGSIEFSNPAIGK
jgi:hypothetical protein